MKTNYEIRYAAHPEDAKSYDTTRIRRDFLIEKIFVPNEVNMVYSMYDRMVVGGALPVGEVLTLEAIDPLKAPFFLTRREMGIYNVGGPGIVKAGDAEFELDYKEALYLGSGDRVVTFESKDAAHPAKFYFNSLTAHRNYPDRKVTKADAVVAEMGSLEGSNHRNINKMLVNQVLPTCQLQMGMTELAPGSVWNTMPAHVHSRRMEAYFYFEIPEDHAICHFMGEVGETRHVWMKGDQAVLSPEWSIHSAAATHNYTFIWGMGGENLDYGDQDFSLITDWNNNYNSFPNLITKRIMNQFLNFSLEGKVALVTGASYGIGFAIASAFAEQGAKVCFNDINQELVDKGMAAYAAKGIKAHGYVCDVTDEPAVQAMVATIAKEVGTIDILVNNAGIIRRVPMHEMDAADFRRVIDIDLNAPFIVAKAVLPAMMEKRAGKIINICSMMSELGRETVSAYAAAKGGLKMLTRNICSEYGEYNIQCNGIGPGYIATPQTAPLREPQADGSRHPFDSFICAKTPAGRWLDPEELTGPAVFLASEASNAVNGHILYVDGGILAYIGKQPK